MVNTGKPSPGCFACRKRRIKCDTTRPECRKCRKRGWECPGYRDLNALRIVDETQKQFSRFSGDKEEDASPSGSSQFNIVRQVQYDPRDSTSPTRTEAASSYPSSVSPKSSPSTGRRPANVYRYEYSDQVPRCIGPPVGEQVYTYFVSNFIQGGALRSQGCFDFLFPLLGNNARDHRRLNPLRLAFSATAMISFAARQKAPELLAKAEAIYLRALAATFSAMGDPERAREDSTLACVTLLTMFEQLRPSRPSANSAEAFGSRLDSAVALMKLRGNDLFKTVVGQKIFGILRSQLASRSLCYGVPLDPELHRLSSLYEQDAAQKRFGELSLRAADLRVAVERYLGGWSPAHPHDGGPPTRAAIAALQQAADALEAEYAAHVGALPLAWKAMALRWPPPPPPMALLLLGGRVRYEGRVDAYADVLLCFLLNWARAARLYVRYCALRCRAWLLGPEADWRAAPEYAPAAALCARLIDDIVASVPYVLGGAAARTPLGAPGARDQPPSLAGLLSMWPLFAASSSDFATDAQRVFLKKTLTYITEEMGIGQAAILAEYNLRSPSMPIAFMRMKQFEAQGRRLQGVAVGAAAGSVMSTGLKDLARLHGPLISTSPDCYPPTIPVGLFKTEHSEDGENVPLEFPSH